MEGPRKVGSGQVTAGIVTAVHQLILTLQIEGGLGKKDAIEGAIQIIDGIKSLMREEQNELASDSSVSEEDRKA